MWEIPTPSIILLPLQLAVQGLQDSPVLRTRVTIFNTGFALRWILWVQPSWRTKCIQLNNSQNKVVRFLGTKEGRVITSYTLISHSDWEKVKGLICCNFSFPSESQAPNHSDYCDQQKHEDQATDYSQEGNTCRTCCGDTITSGLVMVQYE